MRRVLLSVSIALLLTGCTLFGGSGVEEVPVDETGIEETAGEEGGALPPTAEGQNEVGGGDIPIETALPGEVIFVRSGQLMVTGTDGANERQLTFAVSGVVNPNLAVSPDGHFLAFTVDRQTLMVIDLELGGATVVDQADNAQIDAPVWSQDSLTLYYHKLAFDPETSAPSESQLWLAPMPPGLPSSQVTAASLSDRITIVPRFGLTGSQLIIQQVPLSGGEDDLGEFFLYDTASEMLTPLAEGFGVWDAYATAGSAKLILFSQDPNDTALYTADLDMATGTVGNINPTGLGAKFTSGRFDLNGGNIAALIAADSGASQAVILQPGGAIITLPTEAGGRDVAYSWTVGSGVVVQRVLSGSQSEILLLPVDGSAGAVITSGESPRVVAGR